MPTPFLWTLGTNTLIIAGDGSAITLKNLANNTKKLGAAITNATAKDMYAGFELKFRMQVAPAVNAPVDLYLIPTQDGTNYADGSDSVDPPPSSLVCRFCSLNTTNQQRISIWDVKLPPFDFKPLIYNRTLQSFTNTNDENQLYMRPYNVAV